MLRYIISLLLVSFLLSNNYTQDFSFNEKALAKKLKIKSKSMYVDLYSNDTLYYSSNERDLNESCLFDSIGNRIEDYYMSFQGGFYKLNYFYDALGRKVKVETKYYKGDSLSCIDVFEYNECGDLIYEIRKGAWGSIRYVIKYLYNDKHQLIKKINYEKSTIEDEYIYDEHDNLIETIEHSSDGTHHYKHLITYDDTGRIIEAVNLNSDGTVSRVDNFKYNYNGMVIENKSSWKDVKLDDRITFYDYDSLSRIIKFVEIEGKQEIFYTKYFFNESGLLIEKRHLSKDNTIASIYRYVYEYY